MIAKRLTTALLAAIGLLLAAPAAAQTDLPQPNGPWTHPQAGVVFPETLGNLERGRIVAFNEAGDDVGVAYQGGGLTLTLYVYPARGGVTCQQEFAGTVSHIANYEGSSLVFEKMASAPDGQRPASARHSRYVIPAGAMREGYPRMVSDAYLFCSPDDRWRVKYRASWPGSEESFPDVMQLIGGIGWPDALLGTD